MTIYECAECGQYKDDDHDPGEAHPVTPWGLMCTGCATEMEEIENQEGGDNV